MRAILSILALFTPKSIKIPHVVVEPLVVIAQNSEICSIIRTYQTTLAL